MNERFVRRNFQDFAPQTALELQLYSDLDKVTIQYMSKLQNARSIMRYENTPYMVEETHMRTSDSITDHFYSLSHFWLALHPILPQVSKVLNHRVMYEYFTLHDDGEIDNGDISAYLQVNGHGVGREEKETASFISQTDILPSASKDALNTVYFDYLTNKKNPSTKNKEALMVKMLDTMEADCHVISVGGKWEKYKDAHQKIVETKFVPYSLRLQKVFLDENNAGASEEIKYLTHHHLYQYQKRGIVFTSFIN